MGSGGGGSSGLPSKKPRLSKQRGRGGGGGGSAGGAECDLSFETDLAAVDSEALSVLEIEDLLPVVLVQRNNFDVVVCRNPRGQIVGTVANVEDLAQLIECMNASNRYIAEVRAKGDTYCTVYVSRLD